MKAKGLDPAAFAVRLGYEPVAGIITVGAVSVESPEAAAVRMDRTKKVAILYLADVFDAEPALRPPVRRCPAVAGLDPENHQCLLIAMQPPVTK